MKRASRSVSTTCTFRSSLPRPASIASSSASTIRTCCRTARIFRTRFRPRTFPNFTSLSGGPYPSHSTGPIYTFNDTLTKVWRNHTFKAGFYLERSGENDGDQINVNTVPGGSSNQNGTFQFSDTRTGLGATSGVGLANAGSRPGRQLYRNRPARLHDLSRLPLRMVRAGFLEGEPEADHQLRRSPDDHDAVQGAVGQPGLLRSRLCTSASTAPKIDPTTGNVIVGSGNLYDGMVIPGSGWPSDACGHGVTQACGTAYNSLFHNYPELLRPDQLPVPAARRASRTRSTTRLFSAPESAAI